jgi:hypothetical protein
MSRVDRLRRRSSRSTASHDRARSLAAERLDGPLEGGESAWLDEHLAGCGSCRAITAAYDADRVMLRSLRDRQPVPPRDLWARTAAAIERESASGSKARRTGSGRRSWPALGVLSGVAVIAVVIAASALSGGFFKGSTIADLPAASQPAVAFASNAPTPGPTPIVVAARSVGWVGTSSNGALAYNVADVEEVCAAERQADCAQVSDADSKRVEIAVRPKSILQSPVKNEAVVVGTDATGDDSVVVIALPTPEPTPSVRPSSTPAPPSSTPEPTPPAVITTPPVSTPTPTPTATAKATARTTAAPTPTPTATVEPTPDVTPPIGPGLSPSPSPTATAAAALAIVSDVTVVGESAAYSPDGDWFAFTARPSDDSAGPDIYVWHVGEKLARPVTKDHASVFASWAGAMLLGSRPASAEATTGAVAARSFFIDPATGVETAIEASVWRPIVDPRGDWAVGWEGTVELGPDDLTTVPATGALVVRSFTPGVGPKVTETTAPVVAEGSFSEFDVRWDETGNWLALWVADTNDPAIGRLSLVHFDPATGRLDRPKGAPEDVTALPGFSIANGRLAWATPPGQGGEGSRVQIVAWTDKSVGAIESGPVEDVVVVH